jgi:AraC-like DNA-binding protein
MLGQKAHGLGRGDLLVWDSKATGKLVVVDSEMVFWSFSVCFDHLLPLFSAGEICLLQDVIENFKGSKHYCASSAVAQECHKLIESAPPHGNVDHRSQMLRVAAAVLSVELKDTRSQRSAFVRIEDHMVQVFQELSADELLKLSIGDLASKFRCSRRHLNRLFHQHLGFSVGALRMEMRLLKAVSLLRDPNTKVISVAEQCGFNHLGLFNTCFKRRFGSSPGKWRKTGLKNQGQTLVAFNGGLPCMVSTENLQPAADNGGISAPIRAKVYQILKETQPRVLADVPFRHAAEKKRYPVRGKKSRASDAAVRYGPSS